MTLSYLTEHLGLTDMQARRHMDDRRKVARIVADERRREQRRALQELAR